MSHRSGLPRHDLLWGRGVFTREELYQRMRYLEPTRPFRSYWQYQNLMFMTAGYLSGKLNGTTWEQVVKDRIFTPLGMSTADLSVADLQRSADYAFGYALSGQTDNDSVVKVPTGISMLSGRPVRSTPAWRRWPSTSPCTCRGNLQRDRSHRRQGCARDAVAADVYAAPPGPSHRRVE
ncbi:MAG: beta-lactamase family protein [Gemmatimonadetes bacterium]|nr:beta-lactamase family protein [Gemmatimonadota bacterium]